MSQNPKRHSLNSKDLSPSSAPFLPVSVSHAPFSAPCLESCLEKLLSGEITSINLQDFDSKGKLKSETEEEEALPEVDILKKENLKGSNDENDEKFLDDRNLYFGDVILVFPNPEQQGVRKSVKVMKALKVYQKAFDTDYYSGQTVFEDALFKAFFIAFENLPDFNGKHENKRNLFQNFVEEIELQELKKRDSRKSKSIQQRNNLKLDVKKVMNLNRFLKPNEIQKEESEVKFKLTRSTSHLKNIKKILMKKMFSQDKKIMIPDKNLYGGTMPNRKMKNEQSKNITQDFSTLMRNTILAKLSCQAGFKSRSFVSSSGEYIFTVLYSRDFNLKITAEKDSFNKQVSLALSDLLSLEPVDRKRRPLRLNTWLKDEFNSAMTKYFVFLKPKILHLLKEINYKMISKELRTDYFEENFEINENDNVPDELWNAYYDYLNILNENIKRIRKRFRQRPTICFTNKKTPKTVKKKPNDAKPVGGRSTSLFHLPIDSSPFLPFSSPPPLRNTETVQNPFANLMNTSTSPLPVSSTLSPNKSKFNPLNKMNSNIRGSSPNNMHTKKFKNELRRDISEEFKELFVKALELVNYQYKKKILITIWDYNRMDYKEAFFDYFITPKNKSFKVRQKLDAMWKRFVVTETGFHSLFNKMERLKLADNTLNKFINMPFLLEENIVQDCFVLNDLLYLTGISAWDTANIKKQLETEMLRTLKFTTTEEENGDIESGLIEKAFLQRKDTLIKNIEKDKVNNLTLEFEFKWTKPTFVPLEKLRNYYGEKVALYFLFISKFTNHMTPIAMCSIIYIILGNLLTDDILLLSTDLAMVFLISFWSNSFLHYWKRQELLFAINYGQLDFEQDEKERSLFKGNYKRSLQNDHLNVLSYPQSKRISKVVIAILFTIVLVSADIIAVYLLIKLSMMLEQQQSINSVENFALVVSIPAGLNYVLNELLNKLYTKFAIKYTSFENYRTLTSFESSYIVKKFLFSMIIMIIPLFMISFVAKYSIYELQCYQQNCFLELKIFTRTNFIFNSFFNLWEVIEPRLPTHSFFYKLKKLFWKTSIEEDGDVEQVDNGNIIKKANNFLHKKIFYETSKQIPTIEEDLKEEDNIDDQEQNYTPLPNSAVQDRSSQSHSSLPSKKKLTSPLAKFPFYEAINRYIESEFDKHSYTESQDIYGTVEDYMEICISYSFFALYGIGDPIIFPFGLLIMVLEIHTDKLKLLKYSRRPLPLGEKSIGIWLSLIELVANASILSNGAVYAFSTYNFENDFAVLLFVILIMGNFVLNWIFNLIFDEIPANMVRIMGRHKNIVEKTLEGIGNKSNKKNLIKKKTPIFKIFNTELAKDNSIQEFEDIDQLDYNLPDKGISEMKLSLLQRKKRAIYMGVYFKEWRTNLTGRKTPHLQIIERTHRKRRRNLGEKEWKEILRKFKHVGIRKFKRKINNFHLPFHYRTSLANIFFQKPRKVSENATHSNLHQIHQTLERSENEGKLLNMEKSVISEYFDLNKNDMQFPEVFTINGLSLYFLDDFKKYFSFSTQFFLTSPNKPFHFLPLKYSELKSMKFSKQKKKDFTPISRIYFQPNNFENSPFFREIWLTKQIQNPTPEDKISKLNGEDQFYMMEMVGYEKWDKELEASFEVIKNAYGNEEIYFEMNEFDFLYFREHKSYFVWVIFKLGVINFEENFFKCNLKEVIKLRKKKEEYYTDIQIMSFLEMFYKQIDQIKLNREMYSLEECFFLQKNNTYKYVPLYPNKIFIFGEFQGQTVTFKTQNEVLYYVGVILLRMIILDSIDMESENDFIFQMIIDLKNEYPLSTKIISQLLQMKNNEKNYNFDINIQLTLDQTEIANEISYITKLKNFNVKKNYKAILRIDFLMGNNEEVNKLFSSKILKSNSENSDINRKNSISTSYLIALLNYFQNSSGTEHLFFDIIEELGDEKSSKTIICYLMILRHKLQEEKLENIDELLVNIWDKFFCNLALNKKLIAYFYEIQGQIHSDLGRNSSAIVSFTRMKEICLDNQINDLLEKSCFYLTKELFLLEDFGQMQEEIRNFPNKQSDYNLIFYACQTLQYMRNWDENQLVDVLNLLNETLIKTNFSDLETIKILLQFIIEYSNVLELLPKSTLILLRNLITIEVKKEYIKNKGIELCLQILDYYIDKSPLKCNFMDPQNIFDYLTLRLSYHPEKKLAGSNPQDQAVQMINFLKLKIDTEGALRKKFFTFELYMNYKLLKDHDKMIETLHSLLDDVSSLQNNSATEFLLNSELAFQHENSECCNYLTKIFKNIMRKHPQILKLKFLFYFSMNLFSKGFHLKSLDFLNYIEKSLYPLDLSNEFFFVDTLLLKSLVFFRLDNLEQSLLVAESLLELIEKNKSNFPPKKNGLPNACQWLVSKRKGVLIILGKIHWRLGRLKQAFYFLDLAWREDGDRNDQLAIEVNIAEIQREAGKIEGRKGLEKLREETNSEQEIDDERKVIRFILNVRYVQIRGWSKEDAATKLEDFEKDALKLNENKFTSFLIQYQIKKLKLITGGDQLDINDLFNLMGSFIYDDIQLLELIMVTLKKNDLVGFKAKLEFAMRKLKSRVKTQIWLFRLSFCRAIFYRKLQKVNKACKIFEKHKSNIQLLEEMPFLSYYFIKEYGKHQIMQGNMIEAENYLRKGLTSLELREDNHFFYWEKAHLYYILGKLYMKYSDIIKEYKNDIENINENELSLDEKQLMMQKLDHFDHDILILCEKNKKHLNFDQASFIEKLKGLFPNNLNQPLENIENRLPLKSLNYKGKLSFEKGIWLITTFSIKDAKDPKLLEKIHKKLRII